MGCTTVPKQKPDFSPPPSTSAGVLKITVTNGVLFHQAGAFKMDPYVLLKLSNQSFKSKVSIKGGKKPSFMESFSFIINSCYAQYGRNLQMTLMDRKKIGSDNFIGYGIVDLNPIINNKKPKEQFRCMLNYEYKQAGFINLIAEFIEQPAQIIHFRFQQAVIRRQTSTITNANCWIQVTIGEEIMKTHKCKNNKKKPPSWVTEVLTFKVFKSIQYCFIRVMDDDEQIGHLKLQISKILATDQEHIFTEDFVFQKQPCAGALKFRTVKGKAPSFSNANYQSNKTVSNQKKIDNQPQHQYFQPNPYGFCEQESVYRQKNY